MNKGINLNTVLLQMRNEILDNANIPIEDFAFNGSTYNKNGDYYINELIVDMYSELECDDKLPYLESVYILDFKNKKELNIDWIEDNIQEIIDVLQDVDIIDTDDVVTEIISFNTTPANYDDVMVSKSIRINLQTRIRSL